MNVYTKKSTNFTKWIIGIIIFILAMTITFSEAHSVNVPPSSINSDQTQTTSSSSDETPANLSTQLENDQGSDPVTAIPEPTTIILLASGLGVIHLVNRRRKK